MIMDVHASRWEKQNEQRIRNGEKELERTTNLVEYAKNRCATRKAYGRGYENKVSTELLEILQQIDSALTYLTKTKCIRHQDVKPENIAFDVDKGVATLIDFGSSKYYD